MPRWLPRRRRRTPAGSKFTPFAAARSGRADQAAARLGLPLIIVGVDNAGDRARTVTSWPNRVVLGVGTNERRGVDTIRTLADILTKRGLGDDRLKVVIQDGGGHNEATWASRFPNAIAFLFRP